MSDTKAEVADNADIDETATIETGATENAEVSDAELDAVSGGVLHT